MAPVIPLRVVQDLSNLLPSTFVENMVNRRLWITALENANSPEARDFLNFLTEMRSTDLISTVDIAEVLGRPATYTLKVEFVRWLRLNGCATPPRLSRQSTDNHRCVGIQARNIEQFLRLLLVGYIEATLTAIDSSGLEAWTPITQQMRQRVSERSLNFEDLSPENRSAWNQQGSTQYLHHYTQTDLQAQSGGRYLINAVFSEAKQILAFDLTRPPEESLVSISHEIVHAADPQLASARRALSQALPQAAQILASLLEIPSNESSASSSASSGSSRTNPSSQQLAEELLRRLLSDVFFEMRRVDVQRFLEVNIQTLSQLAESSTRSIHADLRHLETSPVLQQLMRSLIQLTVENEYRAYTYSLALYHVLKDRRRLLRPSMERQEFIRLHFQHPHSLIVSQTLAQNPLNQIGSLGDLEDQILAPTHPSRPQIQEINRARIRTLNGMKTLLESHYLTQSRQMMEEIAERNRPLFEIIQRANSSDNGTAHTNAPNGSNGSEPEWTRPGSWESPTNPFLLLQAKVSTAAVFRFQQGLDNFTRSLRRVRESLLGLNAGFLGLQDATIAELRLLGLRPMDETPTQRDINEIRDLANRSGATRGCVGSGATPTAQSAAEVIDRFFTDQDDLNPEIREMMAEFQWRPRTTAEFVEGVPQSEVMGRLLRLRLLKTVRWLRAEFPVTRDLVNGVLILHSNLALGRFNRAEISQSRAKELMQELTEYRERALMSEGQLRQLEFYFHVVIQAYALANELRWAPVVEELRVRIRQTQELISAFGEATNSKVRIPTFGEISAQMKTDVENLRAQVAIAVNNSQRSSVGSCPANGAFDVITSPQCLNLGEFQFPLTLACMNGSVFVVRQPLDRVAAPIINALPRGNGSFEMRARVLGSPRPVLLEPFTTYRRSGQ